MKTIGFVAAAAVLLSACSSVPPSSIVKQPTSLSFVEGASIWMMFVTVYGALVGFSIFFTWAGLKKFESRALE